MRNFGSLLTSSIEFMSSFIFDDLARKFNAKYEGTINVIFNTDIAVNETETIANIRNSVGILSNETLIKQHPYVDDPQREIELIENENAAADANLAQTLAASRPANDEIVTENVSQEAV
jgi:hypothetical protein